MRSSTTVFASSATVTASACACSHAPVTSGAAALRALPVRSVILDGEGVICGPDGFSDFDRMRAVFSRKGSPDVFLYAFDVLEMDGHDLRAQSWDRDARC